MKMDKNTSKKNLLERIVIKQLQENKIEPMECLRLLEYISRMDENRSTNILNESIKIIKGKDNNK